ncbi:MAG: OmpA family protein [Stellaceae bacterium]
MKWRWVAAAAMVGLGFPVMAAAHGWMGPAYAWSAPSYDWSGPYVGLQGGYAWGDSTGGLSISGFPVPYHPEPKGIIGGAHAGFDWQWGHFVLGAEGDIEGANITGSDTQTHIANEVKVTNNLDASLRGKAGLAVNRVLFYGTGGVAFGQVKTDYSCPTCFHYPDDYDKTTGIRVGWTAGGGVEVALNPKWSAAVEYRYTDLGTQSFADPDTTAADTGSRLAFTTVTLGVSYRFLPPARPASRPAPFVPVMAPVPMPMPPPQPHARAPRPHAFVVYFDFDRHDLTLLARRVLRDAAKTFRATGYARVEITGYTDLAGSQAYNMKLSKRRAVTVAEFLAGQGVPRRAMDVMWRGKANPRVPTANGVRAPKNRRVEILMP